MALRLLVIDDDQRLFSLLRQYFEENDVVAEHAPDGSLGLERALSEAFDAIVLDVMMPGMDGLTTLRKLRQRSTTPVVMLTAKGDETDRVVGLELGADDYLPKPFSPRELLARIRAVLRRARPEAESRTLGAADVTLDKGTRSVTAFGESIDLTGLEFDLLATLLERPGRVVSRSALLELAGRSDTTVNDRAVDVHISHLRKKLRDGERQPPLIQTVRGIGYVLGKR